MFDYMGATATARRDKLKAFGAKLREGEKVDAPLLDDCPVNIECTVVNSIVTGSHEMFVGKVEQVHADARLVGEDGKIDFKSIDFV